MKKYLWLILLILLVVPVHAQENDFTASDLYDWSHTLYFPHQVELTLLAKRSESEIRSLNLLINYEGSDPITIALETVVTTSTPSGTIYSYTWEIPDNPPPRLFSNVRYQWNITTIDGLEVNALDNFTFEDTRVTWVRSDDVLAQVNIYYAQNSLDPDNLRDGVRRTYDLLFADTNDKPSYNLLIYPENTPVGCARNDDEEPVIIVGQGEDTEEIPCDLDLANQIIADSGFLLFNQTDTVSIQQTLIDILVEARYTDVWGEADVPDWFLRGLQRFYDPLPDLSALTIAQQRFRSDDLLSLAELANEPTDDDLYTIWDAQSIGLVLYIADNIGVEGLYNLADDLDDSTTFAEAYEDATGDNIDLLLLSWQDWLFRSSTEDDYQYNPYISNTATPTVTPTATNTPTETFTPSKTPDVTSTPRPTFTRIPPTATITPLPAQSFSVQPTDIPPTPDPQITEPTTLTDDADLVTRAAIGGSVVLLLLIILFFVLRR